MKQRGILIVVLICLMAVSVSAVPWQWGNDVQLTPTHPTRLSQMTCEYTVEEAGVFKFEFFKNNDIDQLLFSRETDKRVVSFRPQGLQNGDTVTCAIAKRDFRGEYNGVGAQVRTVGAFDCNDLIDNDNDNNIDMQDPGCGMPNDNDETEPVCNDNIDNDNDGLFDLDDPGCNNNRNRASEKNEFGPQCDNGLDDDGNGIVDLEDAGCEDPTDNIEKLDYNRFCRDHPRNIFCKGLGLNALLQICDRDAGNPLCDPALVGMRRFCTQNPIHSFCVGAPSLANRCDNIRGDPYCNELQSQIEKCNKQNKCLELTNADESLLCSLQDYEFCPEQDTREERLEAALAKEQERRDRQRQQLRDVRERQDELAQKLALEQQKRQQEEERAAQLAKELAAKLAEQVQEVPKQKERIVTIQKSGKDELLTGALGAIVVLLFVAACMALRKACKKVKKRKH